MIPNLPHSDNGRLRRDGNTVPNQAQKFFKTAGFRFILAKTSFPVENNEDDSGAWQPREKLSITVAARAKSPCFRVLEMKSRISPNSVKLCAFGAESSAGLPNLPNLPFSELRSQSNTNSESCKPTVFRIGTNQTHPMCRGR